MTALLFAGILTSCNSQNSVTVNGEKMKLEDGMYAKIQTPRGDILLTLHDDKTPLTVANFVGLAEGKIENKAKAQGEPYYDGLKFHRVIKDFMIQGGDPMGNGSGGPGYSFADEFHPDLRHDGPGVLSMANSGPATNGSQFFITHKETPWLNDKHTVFGKVINGQEVVDAIQQGDAIEKVEIIRIGKKAKDFDAVKVFNEEQENALKEQEAKRKEQENVINDQKKQIGWGSQIRSYVLHPYKLIKDLRSNHESSDVNNILDGEIDGFLEKSLYI